MIFWLLTLALAVETVLVPEGSTWSYLDTGVDPASDWATVGFDDTAWGYGPAPIGYGDWDIITEIDSGPDPLNRPITNWFRHEFIATGVSNMTALSVTIRRDDGAVVYLNGTELLRTNMPAGPITSATTAASTVEVSAEAALT